MTYGIPGIHLISVRRNAREPALSAQGRGEVGGKAQGLLQIHDVLTRLPIQDFRDIVVDIPPMLIVGTSVFDAFLERNGLREVGLSDLSDGRISRAFQNGDIPFEVLGELRILLGKITTPLAVRSSSLLEDETRRPFAGVYVTKMIPNNQPDPDVRLRKLLEAIKLVWASTYFQTAKDYCRATGLNIADEKMAVVIQEVVGKRHHDRYYPELSGVARSFNYYPVKPAVPEDGVVTLALGLGKTIVDGEKSWTYSPAYPQQPPPFNSIDSLLQETQNELWVVNMCEVEEYNPVQETEFLRRENLMTADRDDVLRYLASTYDPQSERLVMGAGIPGPRALTFAPLLTMNDVPFSRLIMTLLVEVERAVGSPVEIEFAMTFDPHRFGFLQVRPMVVPSGDLRLVAADLIGEQVLAASAVALGNGILTDIADVVYVKPESFNLQHTRRIAGELEQINNALLSKKRPYLLIVFGRLGTFDPWLGIPVTWGQICGARVILEATQDNVRVELSQGSHYFHNIINLGIKYFSMPFAGDYRIDWEWLSRQPFDEETEFVRHICLPRPLRIKVDGRNSLGVILKPQEDRV
jgi:hypothetical protein